MAGPPETSRSRWGVVGGLRVHARSWEHRAPPGSPRVVLVHGMGVSARTLVPIGEHLANRYRVVAPDLPGFGLSDHPRDILDVPGLANALAAWMRAYGIDRAALLGNSFGCQCIAECAVRHPDLVDRAVLQGPTIPPWDRSAFWQLVRWRQNSPGEPLDLLPAVLRDYRDAGIGRVLGTFRAALEDRIEEKLPRMTMPVLVVRGGKDRMCPQDWAEMVARLVPDGRLRVIPGAPHTVVFTAPLELARVVRPFLDEMRAPGP